MDRCEIIKKVKRVGKLIAKLLLAFLFVLLLVLACCWFYSEYYKPYRCRVLYEEGIRNINKADSIALLIDDLGFDDKADSLLENAALKGSVSSQVRLGERYEDSNNDKSAYWYLIAAQNGNAKAQGKIGEYYYLKENFAKAVCWTKRGADNGDSDAQYNMGNLYLRGIALYDLDFLHTRYKYMGDGRFITGQHVFGIELKGKRLEDILNHPYNVYLKRDLNKAKYYWKLAAKQGHRQAKDALEKIYE